MGAGGRPTQAERAERDADVLDSLRTLGPSTLAQLHEHTGRTHVALRSALMGLVGRGEAEVVEGRYARRWRAA
jgi:hypothetical protein